MLVRMPPAAEAVRRSFEELSNTTQSMGALRRSDQISTGTGDWALDQEHRKLAEQIRIDQTYIGEQSGDFKLPDGGAVGSGSTACSAKVALLIARLQNLHCRFRFGPRLKNRVAGKGDVRRIGMRHPGAVLRQGIQDNVKCGYLCVSKILFVLMG